MLATPWAGPVELPMSLIIMILAIVGLGPPLVVSLIATAAHVLRRKEGEVPRGGRTFLTWMGVSTVVWLALLWLNGLNS
jgi:hypothetical protein